MLSRKFGTYLLNGRISTLKMEAPNSYEISVPTSKHLGFRDEVEAKNSSETVIICRNSGLLL
jgi:hypothetical protein